MAKARQQDQPLENKNYILSTKDICDFFEISRETLSTWAKKGAPKYSRGKWDLKALVKWRYSGDTMESPSLRKLKAEADLKEAKAKQEKIKLSVVKQEYVPVAEVKDELTRLMMNLKKSMLAVGHHVASELAPLDADAAEIAKTVVDKRMKEALEEMSKGGVYRGRKKRAK